MFVLVSVRHVGAHPGEYQHGVSIQISISLGKAFLRISRIRNIPLSWILARVFVYVPPFISQILDFIYWTVLIFILIYFEWRDTENQQLHLQIVKIPTIPSWFRGLFVMPKFWLRETGGTRLANEWWASSVAIFERGRGRSRDLVIWISFFKFF